MLRNCNLCSHDYHLLIHLIKSFLAWNVNIWHVFEEWTVIVVWSNLFLLRYILLKRNFLRLLSLFLIFKRDLFRQGFWFDHWFLVFNYWREMFDWNWFSGFLLLSNWKYFWSLKTWKRFIVFEIKINLKRFWSLLSWLQALLDNWCYICSWALTL